MKTMQFLQSLRSISTIPSEVHTHIHTYFLFFYATFFPLKLTVSVSETRNSCSLDRISWLRTALRDKSSCQASSSGYLKQTKNSIIYNTWNKWKTTLFTIPETNEKQHYLQYLKQTKNSIIYNTWNKQKTA